jgi:hypothetical protein
MILAAIGLAFGYISPTYTNGITAAQAQIASYDSALVEAAAFSQKEADLTTQENTISPADMARLQTYMPDGVDNIQLIVDLDSLASKYGVVLSGFSIQNNSVNDASSTDPNAATDGTASGGIQSTSLTNSLDLSVTATGTYNAFQAFLATAEQSSRPLDVTKLSLKSSSTGVYTYTITFRIYWLK